jgi:hypothetical protein
MSDEPRGRTYARRFLLIWGALAVLCFLIAAILTALTVRVTGAEPPFNPIGMYGRYRGNATGWIYYYKVHSGGRYLIYYPPRTTLIALPYEKLISCTENRPSERSIGSGRIATSQYQNRFFYLIRISGDPTGSALGGEATCTLDLQPTRISFIGFSLDMWFPTSVAPGLQPVRTLNFSVQIEGAENMEVFGAQSTSSSSAALGPDDESVIEFNDVRREGLRDTILIVIGALVGLGAAMALEAMRPYVEKAASGRFRSRR